MVSELASAPASPGQAAPAQTRPPSPDIMLKRPEIKADAAPKVVAPKPIEIKFDQAQATKNLKEAVSLLNKQMADTGRGLGFSYDESKASAVIKVSDINTGEVVRQIPSEDVLRIAHKIDDLKGILYNRAV
jgi:flagellar protein FlaG